MVFSIFERYKPEHKVQLKNPNKVVIGSGTDLESAFQIGNFMNMLFFNINNKQQAMTNSGVKHNLFVELFGVSKCTWSNESEGLHGNYRTFHIPLPHRNCTGLNTTQHPASPPSAALPVRCT